MNELIIGIDLGTTNSEVSIVENGQVTIIAEGDQKIFPSIVGLADDNSILVGTPAKNQYELYPERTIRSVKRQMGTDQRIALGDNTYSPQEISAIILKRLKEVAEKHIGQSINKAVITVPAYFSDVQRQATREAGEIAGLEVVRMINEPTAAALAYEVAASDSKRVLVYDLGGGTFDVSVVSIQNEVVEVLASHGNNHLGGDDFDNKIIETIQEHLQQAQGVDITANTQAMARIKRAAETAKINLSNNPFAIIEEEFLCTHEGQPVHLSLELPRDDYETLITPYIDETLEAIHTALDGANLTASDIDEVLLVGGSTRTPIIHQRLKNEFGLQPRSEINPDLCVATGAAMQAATIAGQSISSILVDITPYAFGTSVLGEKDGELYPFVYSQIIEKNRSLPISKSEVYVTSADYQESIEVNIYQGEDADALNNIAIGQFKVEGLSKVEAGNPIIITLSLDLNGILKVTAKEKNTSLQKSITIDNAISGFDEAEIIDAQARIQALFGNDEDREEATFIDQPAEKSHKIHVQAQALIEKAQRLMDDASDDDKEDLVDQIESIRDAITNDESENLQSAMDELTDLIYYLET